MSSVKELVDNAISQNQVAIFSKTYCPYCAKTKSLFAKSYGGVSPKIYELDDRDDGDAIQNYLFEKTGQRSVPNVFINGEHIGGNDDTQKAEKEGRLAKLLAKAT